jgi:hypothetical protein
LSAMRQNNQQRTVASQVPRSQFLCFYLWGNLKGKVYNNNPCSTEALQNEIACVIASITVDQLQKVSRNLFMQCEACLRVEGGHFKHGKFVLSFYSILINVCMYRNWHEGISEWLHSHYRGRAQLSWRNVPPALHCKSRFLFGWTHCNTYTKLHILQITVAHTKSSNSVMSSLVIAWWRLLTMEIYPLPCSQVTTSYECRLMTLVWSGNLLLAATSTVIVDSESHGTQAYFTVSQLWVSYNAWLTPPHGFHWCLLYSLGMDHTENTASSSSFVEVCVFVAIETCLQCHYLATSISSVSAVVPFRRYVTVWSPFWKYSDIYNK